MKFWENKQTCEIEIVELRMERGQMFLKVKHYRSPLGKNSLQSVFSFHKLGRSADLGRWIYLLRCRCYPNNHTLLALQTSPLAFSFAQISLSKLWRIKANPKLSLKSISWHLQRVYASLANGGEWGSNNMGSEGREREQTAQKQILLNLRRWWKAGEKSETNRMRRKKIWLLACCEKRGPSINFI